MYTCIQKGAGIAPTPFCYALFVGVGYGNGVAVCSCVGNGDIGEITYQITTGQGDVRGIKVNAHKVLKGNDIGAKAIGEAGGISFEIL